MFESTFTSSSNVEKGEKKIKIKLFYENAVVIKNQAL